MSMVFEISSGAKTFTVATQFSSKSVTLADINTFITDWKDKKVMAGVLSKSDSIDWKIA